MAASHNGADDDRITNDRGVSLTTFLDNYRHVQGHAVAGDCVSVTVDADTRFYDSDAVIGALVRKFGLQWVELADGGQTLRFRRGDGGADA